MVVDIPFDYTSLLAFKTLLRIGNERKLSIDKVIKYREKLLELAVEDYVQGDRVVKNEKWSGPITFKKIDYDKEIVLFLKKYRNIFSISNGIITVNDDVNLDFLNDEIDSFDISSRIIGWATDYHCLEILGIDNFKNLLSNLVKLESRFEEKYFRLLTQTVDRELIVNINMGLILRSKLIKKMSCFKDEVIESFYYFVLDKIFDDDTINYTPFPIDVDNYAKSKYFTEEENLHTTLFKPYLFAVFGTGKMDLFSVFEQIEKIYDMNGEKFVEELIETEDEYDEVETDGYDEDSENYLSFDDSDLLSSLAEEEFAFYLKYVDNIDRFLISHGENSSLVNAKYRLLFILDKQELCLYNKFDFYKALDKVLEYDFHQDAFDQFEKEAKFFIEEIFENDIDIDYTTKKILFIKTYYEMTGNREIIEIFNHYKNHWNYKKFYNMVFDKNSYIRTKKRQS